MTKNSITIISVLIGLLLSSSVFAKMPKALLDTWTLDIEETTKALKKSPEWNKEAEKMLPMIMSHMSKGWMRIENDIVVSYSGGREEKNSVKWISSSKNKHKVKITAQGKDAVVTFQILPGNRLKMLVDEKKGDMDSFIWKKGKPNKSSLKQDADMLAAMIEGALKEDLSNASKSKPKKNIVKKEPKPKPVFKHSTKYIPESNNSGLTLAFIGNKTSQVKEILQKHPDWINAHYNDTKMTLLMRHVSRAKPEMLKLFKGFGVDVTLTDLHGENALFKVGNNAVAAKWLIENGVDPNAKSRYGNTPLLGQRYPEVVKVLLENKADPNVESNSGWTPMSMAKHKKRTEIIKLLAEYGAK